MVKIKLKILSLIKFFIISFVLLCPKFIIIIYESVVMRLMLSMLFSCVIVEDGMVIATGRNRTTETRNVIQQ